MSTGRVPTYDSRANLDPTPVDPRTAAELGNSVADLGKGVEGLGEVIQKLDNQRQTLKAQTYLAKANRANYQLAATDPNIDGLDAKVAQNSDEAVQQAANLIQSPSARNEFVEKATYHQEIRNVPIANMIMRRKSQDFKNSLVQANDEDIKTYTALADPEDRKLLKEGIIQRTDAAIKDGHVNAQWAKLHVDTLLKQADHKQVEDDMSLNAEHTYAQLQKGAEGLYPDLSPKERQYFADKAQKLITKQGTENKMIYGIAQNHTENTLIDKMANNSLTQMDVNNSVLFGINGIKARPDFAKAATEALEDPFPTEPAPEKYSKLFDMVTNTDKSPAEVKLDILRARGVTPQQKAHLINAALREDQSGDGKQSIDQLIKTGVQKNKQQIMELNRKIQKEVEQKRTFLGQVGNMFSDHAKDDAHLSDLQQQFMAKVNDNREQQSLVEIANTVINHDTIARNPRISTADAKGTIFMDKTTGVKRKYYPDGHFEPVK